MEHYNKPGFLIETGKKLCKQNLAFKANQKELFWFVLTLSFETLFWNRYLESFPVTKPMVWKKVKWKNNLQKDEKSGI